MSLGTANDIPGCCSCSSIKHRVYDDKASRLSCNTRKWNSPWQNIKVKVELDENIFWFALSYHNVCFLFLSNDYIFFSWKKLSLFWSTNGNFIVLVHSFGKKFYWYFGHRKQWPNGHCYSFCYRFLYNFRKLSFSFGTGREEIFRFNFSWAFFLSFFLRNRYLNRLLFNSIFFNPILITYMTLRVEMSEIWYLGWSPNVWASSCPFFL